MDLAGLRVRQRLHQHRVGHADHGGVGPNPEGERRDRDSGEAGVSRHHPQAVTQVLAERVEPADAVHAIDLLANLRRVPELSSRGGPGLAGRQAGPLVTLGEHRDMHLELGGGVGIVAPACRDEAEPGQRASKPGPHVGAQGSGAVRNSLAMTAEMRSQFLVSAVSCRRPALVIA